MEALRHAAELAQQGHGQIVAVVAEAGVGKSRLFHEFKARNRSGWMVLEAVSVPDGKGSAFLPVIDLLWGYFKITADDNERTRREKITGRVLALDRTLEDSLPYLYALLGLAEPNSPVAEVEPQTRKRRSLEAIKLVLLRESLDQSLMIEFEDLHGIDSESRVFLNLLADSIGTAQILLLVNYRPEYQHDWGGRTYYTQLRLDPLGKESAEEMLYLLLGDGKDLIPLKRLIIEKTEGNPLFMEEIFQALAEDGSLKRNGTMNLMRPVEQIKIPPTVQDILASRIDRLSVDHKELLQTLAVIGKEFPLALAQEVVEKPEGELSLMLNNLQLAEFIYEQPGAGDVEYTFKHPLTQEAAYKSVLIERRKLLHERIGAALESLYPQTPADHLDELAHHYAHGSNAMKAVEYCLRACQQCADRASSAEALAHYETGLARLQELPDDDQRAELELALRIASHWSLATIKGYGSAEAERSAARAMELAQRLDINWEKSWLALRGLLTSALVRPDVPRAREIATELLTRAEQHKSAEHLTASVHFLAFVNMLAGAFDLAAEGFDRGAALYESMPKPKTSPLPPHLLLPSQNFVLSAWNLWFLGYPDRALAHINAATAIARESGYKSDLEAVCSYAMGIYQLRNELEHMRESAELTMALATELGNPFRRARAEIHLGWAEVSSGDLASGIAQMQCNLSESRATGSDSGTEYYLALIATALGRTGRFDEGLRTIEQALPLIEKSDERLYEAEVHRLKGELLLAKNASDTTQAEQCFRKANDIARRQKAKSWELRATASLARHLRDTNRRYEARVILSEIYNWFTEGFDTADLKDAKTLLEELRG